MRQHESFSDHCASSHQITGCTSNHQSTGYVQQGSTGIELKPPPQLVSTKQQRNIAGIFPIRLPDNPRLAVRGAMTMRWCELIETKHAVPARCQVHGRCAAHGPKADDDNSTQLPSRDDPFCLEYLSIQQRDSCVRSKAG
jgi:hypothetical protein